MDLGFRALPSIYMYGCMYVCAYVCIFMSICLCVCSKWPTVPQVFVDGEFIGGSDILMSMHKAGELDELLLPAKPSSPSPSS